MYLAKYMKSKSCLKVFLLRSINQQKSTAFLCPYNKQVKSKLIQYHLQQLQRKYAILFTTAPKKMKYLGVRLTKHVWDLYVENDNMLWKEIKGD